MAECARRSGFVIHQRWAATRRPVVAIAVVLCACGSPRKDVAGGPSPSGDEVIASRDADADTVAYAMMGVAAASQLKQIAGGKSVAMFQTDSKSAAFRGVVTTVIEVYGFKEIHPGEADYACARKPRRPTALDPALPNCAIDVADILLQFNSIQMTRDSGFIGGLVTQIMRGDTKPRTTAFCVTAARHGREWIGAHHSFVDEPRDCAADRRH